MITQAVEGCWENLLVIIQLNPTQTGLFEDKVNGEGVKIIKIMI